MATTASGADAKLAAKLESVVGTPPGGDWNLVRGASLNLGATQQFNEADLFGLGRSPQQRSRDIKETTGQATLPIDLNELGIWLAAALGPPLTAGSTDFTHTFESGENVLETLSIEQQHEDLATEVYFLSTGVRVNSFTFRMEPRGQPTFDVNMIGLTAGVASNASVAGTPAQIATFLRFSQFDNLIEINTGGGYALLDKNTIATLTYDNRMETVYYNGGKGFPGDINPGPVQLSGELTLRLTDKAIYDLADAGTVFGLRMSWFKDLGGGLTTATQAVVLTMPQVEIGSGPAGIQGGAGVESTFQWSGHDGASKGLTLELRNQYAGAEYAS